jgi:hypothetical protein
MEKLIADTLIVKQKIAHIERSMSTSFLFFDFVIHLTGGDGFAQYPRGVPNQVLRLLPHLL